MSPLPTLLHSILESRRSRMSLSVIAVTRICSPTWQAVNIQLLPALSKRYSLQGLMSWYVPSPIGLCSQKSKVRQCSFSASTLNLATGQNEVKIQKAAKDKPGLARSFSGYVNLSRLFPPIMTLCFLGSYANCELYQDLCRRLQECQKSAIPFLCTEVPGPVRWIWSACPLVLL